MWELSRHLALGDPVWVDSRAVASQRKGDLAGAAGQVEQSTTTARRNPGSQIIEHRRGVRRAEPVVIRSGALVKVLSKPRLVSHAERVMVITPLGRIRGIG
jgi:hypothetical protein